MHRPTTRSHAFLTFLLGAVAPQGEANLFLGFPEPGDEPQVFAPGIVSLAGEEERGCCPSPDGKELYFCRAAPSGPDVAIWVVREQAGKLLAPRLVSFAGVYRDFNPFLTPDGRYLLFYRDGFGEATAERGTWISEREGASWGEPCPFSTDYGMTSADMETFYFNFDAGGAQGRDIGMRRMRDGSFSDPVSLPGAANSTAWDAHPFVSGDGSFLVFDSMRPGGYDPFDMYVSFRRTDGTWSAARNLGAKINRGHRSQPSLSADGRLLFFAAEGDIWWVRSGIGEALSEPLGASR